MIASASVLSVNNTGVSSSSDASFNKPAKTSASLVCAPTTILDGCKLSYKARPSLKNSGEKIIFSYWYFSRIVFVYPTGIVDLIMIVAWSLYFKTVSIASSTLDVSK